MNLRVYRYEVLLRTTRWGAPMRKQRVITTNGIRQVLEAGGQIQYRPAPMQKKMEWALWARYPDEPFVHVISSKTGELRFFKSADAVYAYHLRLFPDVDGVFIPASTVVTHEFPPDRRSEQSASDAEDDGA